ncbi:DddA-like double-stranded DNA deaminase toxin [Glycomyces xiaoerkulensis]|uniref:DddA-like double-stranded DNA deaminase toxin n=1 Tax=Glycomyces xiaoerkulensis TaxID=2038139 RepID=UPI000C269DB3|nr:DddA-like double-stranded DNA deaminase toxin [Glycomyces xiaoerkulensis]
MSLASELVTRLRTIIEQARQAGRSAEAARSRAEAAAEGVGSAAEGTGSVLPGETLAHWRRGDRALSEAAALFESGARKGEEYIALVESRSAGSGRAAPPVPSARAANTYDPTVHNSGHAEAIQRFGWSRNATGRIKARGLLYDDRGRPVLHRPLKALGGDKVYHAPDLQDRWRTREVATSWHIEGGVAAYMRRTRTPTMALWLNVPSCGGPGRPDANGCHENLPKVLPKGYTLHVHVHDERGNHWHNAYQGTGEALK